MKKFILGLYLMTSAANVLAKILESDMLEQLTKPLLMPVLIGYVYLNSIGNTTRLTLLLCVALLFSWFGDLALMYQSGDTYFLLGICMFLIAQLLYIYLLGKSTYHAPYFHLVKGFPFLLFIIVFFFVLLPAGIFTLPIVVYGTVITTMAIVARLREGCTSSQSYQLALWGGIFFVVSDAILAYDIFRAPIPYAGVYIMTTYCAAQLLLVMGILKHLREEASLRT